MLAAHLAPGYCSAIYARRACPAAWTGRQRAGLWAAALASTVAPDLDVVYNALFRGFFNHSTLWTHSLWPYLGLVAFWAGCRLLGRWPYARMLLGLAAAGGLSHLFLDVISHGTPLFY